MVQRSQVPVQPRDTVKHASDAASTRSQRAKSRARNGEAQEPTEPENEDTHVITESCDVDVQHPTTAPEDRTTTVGTGFDPSTVFVVESIVNQFWNAVLSTPKSSRKPGGEIGYELTLVEKSCWNAVCITRGLLGTSGMYIQPAPECNQSAHDVVLKSNLASALYTLLTEPPQMASQPFKMCLWTWIVDQEFAPHNSHDTFLQFLVQYEIQKWRLIDAGKITDDTWSMFSPSHATKITLADYLEYLNGKPDRSFDMEGSLSDSFTESFQTALHDLDSVREETEKLEQRHPYSHLIDSIIDLASEKFPEYRQETTQPVVQPEPQIRHGSESHTSSKSKSIPLLEASLPQAQPRMGLRSQSRALEQAETSLGTTNQQTDVPHGSGDLIEGDSADLSDSNSCSASQSFSTTALLPPPVDQLAVPSVSDGGPCAGVAETQPPDTAADEDVCNATFFRYSLGQSHSSSNNLPDALSHPTPVTPRVQVTSVPDLDVLPDERNSKDHVPEQSTPSRLSPNRPSIPAAVTESVPQPSSSLTTARGTFAFNKKQDNAVQISFETQSDLQDAQEADHVGINPSILSEPRLSHDDNAEGPSHSVHPEEQLRTKSVPKHKRSLNFSRSSGNPKRARANEFETPSESSDEGQVSEKPTKKVKARTRTERPKSSSVRQKGKAVERLIDEDVTATPRTKGRAQTERPKGPGARLKRKAAETSIDADLIGTPEAKTPKPKNPEKRKRNRSQDESSSPLAHGSAKASNKRERSLTAKKARVESHASSSKASAKAAKVKEKPKQRRRAWDEDTEKLFIREVLEHHDRYDCMAYILKRHGTDGSISQKLVDRTNVMLKDKAIQLSTKWARELTRLNERTRNAFRRFPPKTGYLHGSSEAESDEDDNDDVLESDDDEPEVDEGCDEDELDELETDGVDRRKVPSKAEEAREGKKKDRRGVKSKVQADHHHTVEHRPEKSKGPEDEDPAEEGIVESRVEEDEGTEDVNVGSKVPEEENTTDKQETESKTQEDGDKRKAEDENLKPKDKENQGKESEDVNNMKSKAKAVPDDDEVQKDHEGEGTLKAAIIQLQCDLTPPPPPEGEISAMGFQIESMQKNPVNQDPLLESSGLGGLSDRSDRTNALEV